MWTRCFVPATSSSASTATNRPVPFASRRCSSATAGALAALVHARGTPRAGDGRVRKRGLSHPVRRPPVGWTDGASRPRSRAREHDWGDRSTLRVPIRIGPTGRLGGRPPGWNRDCEEAGDDSSGVRRAPMQSVAEQRGRISRAPLVARSLPIATWDRPVRSPFHLHIWVPGPYVTPASVGGSTVSSGLT